MTLGDLHPGMSVDEEENDEASHYSFRGCLRRLRPAQPEVPAVSLNEDAAPGEAAPGEEAFQEAGPLQLPAEELEEVADTDEDGEEHS